MCDVERMIDKGTEGWSSDTTSSGEVHVLCCAVLLPVVLSPRPAVTCHPQVATAFFSRGTKPFSYWLDPSCCKINQFSTCIKGHNPLQFLPARYLHFHGNKKPTPCLNA